jgi:hypothetical protein
MITASTIERGLRCPGHAALPHVTTQAGKHADRGTAIGAYVAAVLSGVAPHEALAALDSEPSWRLTCEGIDFGIIMRGFER